MSVTVSQYVLKVSSRCDLACDHCYVYEHADQSWRHKPRNIDAQTVSQAAWRIAEHAGQHELSRVHVVLHGGEPLLLGHDGLRRVIETLRSLIDPVARLDLRIHTNGVRLDESVCGLFSEYGVQVGISLDGDRAANDRHRRFANGQSSFPQAGQALALLRRPEYRHLYAGILCTIDVRNDPIAVYEALLAEAPPRLDFLLPHATWDQPPYRPPGSSTPYADWLGRIHARWLADGRPLPIRFFDSLLAAWEGRPSGSEAAGLDPVDLLVIETDGSWEQADSLKTAYDGAPATGLDVFTHSVNEAVAHPGVAARQVGLAARCATCRDCELVRACGGGLYAHRYKSGSGFDNPSVYCDELKVLIPQVISRPRTAAVAPEREIDLMGPHVMSEAAFDLLSAGPGDVAVMETLADSRSVVNRVLVAHVASALNGKNGELRRAAAEGWELLTVLDREQPGVVSDVLAYPYVQAWAAHCLREDAAADPDLDRDRAHLAGLAATAAMRAGLETELLLPVRDGFTHLPGEGALAVGTGTGPVAVVRIAPSGVSSRHGTGEWRAVRRVGAAQMSFTVEDLDPFRDCHAWTPAGRLAAPDWDAWHEGLTQACQQLAAEVPAYAAVMAAGLRSVVPMRPGSGRRQSGTSRRAVGALALALPGDVAMLSELLVHEMQHSKLAALSDLIDLVHPADDGARFAVPWRDDLRPVDALLQGTYAHLAVAELWRVRSSRVPDGRALELFRTYRSWVENGIDSLRSADNLTPEGERFVAGMGAAVQAWADDG
jgi:uncharacterized protein